MRIGCCTNMHASAAGGTGAERIGLLAELGFDYAELPLTELMGLDARTFRQVAGELANCGIPCEACNNFFPRSMRLTGAEADLDAALDYAARAIDRAAGLGAKVIVFGSGPARNVPHGFNQSEAFRQLVRLLQEISPIAADGGITLAIEHLRREECNIINTFREACSLADAAGSPGVRVLADYYHFACEKEDPRHVAVMGKERIAHLHFACAKGRVFPANIDEDEGYMPFIKALEIAGYRGRASIEAYSDSLKEDAIRGLSFMRTYFS